MAERGCAHCGNPFRLQYANSPQQYCSRSCGAARKNVRHGMSYTPVHNAWCDMRKRCTDPGHHAWDLYGGRGIRVCERWDRFENFYEDMGDKPDKTYSLERIDGNGNYEPGNCKWATKTEQSRNRRNVFTAEQDETLRTYLPQGYNFRQIGAMIGKTKTAVSARAYRLGLRSIALPPRKDSPLHFRAVFHDQHEVGK